MRNKLSPLPGLTGPVTVVNLTIGAVAWVLGLLVGVLLSKLAHSSLTRSYKNKRPKGDPVKWLIANSGLTLPSIMVIMIPILCTYKRPSLLSQFGVLGSFCCLFLFFSLYFLIPQLHHPDIEKSATQIVYTEKRVFLFNSQFINRLVHVGADVRAKDNEERSALHLAAEYA